MLKTAAMVGWSGVGSFDDLERSAIRKLKTRGVVLARRSGMLALRVSDPVTVARSLGYLPGVSWIAVGFLFEGQEGYLRSLEDLARRYLTKGKSFRISAYAVASSRSVGDVVLAGNSHLLSVIDDARVNERKPDIRFHVSFEGDKGACGVEIGSGPGGYPTNGTWVTCLVSGGENSSSMTWMSALSGFSLRLVHSATDDKSLLHVARLYSELSFRMDERSLELVVLRGDGSPVGRIGKWLREHDETSFAGLRPRQTRGLTRLAVSFPNLRFPLLILQEDEIKGVYRSLGLGRASGGKGIGLTLHALKAGGKYQETRFGGSTADSNTVIDAIRRGSA